MTTEIANFDIDALDEVIGGAESRPTIIPPIGFNGNTGKWVIGFDKEAMELGTEAIVGAKTMTIGLIGFQAGKFVHEDMISVFDVKSKGMPLEENMPPIKAKTERDGYNIQRAIAMKVDGVDYQFKGSSVGIKMFMEDLAGKIKAQYGVNPNCINPVITIDALMYHNKNTGNDNHNPMFKIVKWVDDNGKEETSQESLT